MLAPLHPPQRACACRGRGAGLAWTRARAGGRRLPAPAQDGTADGRPTTPCSPPSRAISTAPPAVATSIVARQRRFVNHAAVGPRAGTALGLVPLPTAIAGAQVRRANRASWHSPGAMPSRRAQGRWCQSCYSPSASRRRAAEPTRPGAVVPGGRQLASPIGLGLFALTISTSQPRTVTATMTTATAGAGATSAAQTRTAATGPAIATQQASRDARWPMPSWIAWPTMPSGWRSRAARCGVSRLTP
jgi:hypothetical protein